jgi:hypothetical protein
MNMTADILDEAAAVLERNGWYQGDFFQALRDDTDGSDVPPRDCPVCGLGAIMIAAGLDPDTDDLQRGTPAWDAALAFAVHLGKVEPGEATIITTNYVISTIGEDWNDTDGRTAQDVTGELRACAAKHRETVDA